ncbi:kinase-like domain-containing protein [Rhizophagus clarus]|uniref:Kinase-like domain-containing protein n=2 Tax=Rhizophagus clarus TaxID=94130 RepID=A0A8H3LR09_9GLOM|nr:kinase-like domain-containing protein [Rhizophagus clarus]
MRKCWNENPLERPSAKEVSDNIKDWIFYPDGEINKELRSNIMEFINAPIGNNNFITEFHPQSCYKSRLLDFNSKEVNKILGSECLDYIVVDDKSSKKLDEIVESECLDDFIVDNIKSFDKTDKN